MVILITAYAIYKQRPLIQNKEELRYFPLLIVYLLVRDIAFTFFPYVEIMYITDLGITLSFYRFLGQFTPMAQKRERVMLSLNLIAMGLLIANVFFQILYPVVLFGMRGWILFNYVLLAVSYNNVSPFNTDNHEVIINGRKRLFQIIFVYHIAMFGTSYDTNLSLVILQPLQYTALLYILNLYNLLQDEEKDSEIEGLSANFNSIFGFMRRIGTAISEKVEMDQVLEYVVKSAVEDTGADGGAIFLIDDFEDALTLKSIYGKFPPPYPVSGMAKIKSGYLQEYMKSTPIPIGKTILGEAAGKGEAIYIRNTVEDERMAQNARNDIMFISSIIIVPLIVSDKVLGVLSVISKDPSKLFSDENFEHLKTFADYTSLSINNLFTYMELLEKQEMEREVGIAAEIQQQLLPARLPNLPNMNISAYSVPAKGVSGDYYDIIPIRKNKIALVMCDVAGKGVPASLVMVMIRTIIHLIAGSDNSADKIMTWVNKGIAGKIALDRFATMSFLTYNMKTGILQYSNAAHHPLMVYRANTGEIENIDTDGIPIGLEKTTHYGLAETKIEKGDILVLYTDGIIEAMNANGDQFSYERLESVIRKNSKESTEVILKKLKSMIKAFVGTARQHDDQTILLAKIK